MRLHDGTRDESDVYRLTSDHEERARGSHDRFVCSKHVSPLYFLGLPKYKCQSAQSLLPLSIVLSRTISYIQACALWKETQLDLSRMQLLTTGSAHWNRIGLPTTWSSTPVRQLGTFNAILHDTVSF